MNLRRALKAAAGSAAIMMCLAAVPAWADARVYVRIGPPAPVVEVRPAPPAPGLIWVPGYHRWDGRTYVWAPGVWRQPPHAHAKWVTGHWAHDRHGYYFVEGHWR